MHGHAAAVTTEPIPSDLVDIAASITSRGPLLRYGAAASKLYRFIRRDPEMDRATFLASLMSLTTARLFFEAKIRGLDPLRWGATRPVRGRTGSLASHPGQEFGRVAERAISSREPYQVLYRFPLVDELRVDLFLRRQHRLGVWNPGWASFWLALVRLGDIPASHASQLRLPWGDAVLVVGREGPVLIYAHEVIQGASAASQAIAHAGRAFNDAFCIARRGRGTPASWQSTAGGVAREFTLVAGGSWTGASKPRRLVNDDAEQALVPDAEAEPVVTDVSMFGDPRSLAHHIRREVFSRSVAWPGSAYTLACYAHQTLLVDRPEAYALASLMSPAAKRLARRVKSAPELLAWLRRHVRDGSVFSERDRVMLPDQIVRHGLGRPLDKALLVFAVSRLLGFGARIVQTTRSAYVLLRDLSGTRLVETGTLQTVESPEGVLTLAFDAARQFGLREAWSTPDLPIESSPIKEMVTATARNVA